MYATILWGMPLDNGWGMTILLYIIGDLEGFVFYKHKREDSFRKFLISKPLPSLRAVTLNDFPCVKLL